MLGSASPTSIALTSADAAYTGVNAEDYAGHVAGAGEVDGDGLADILVGATASSEGGADAGAVYLVLGSSAPTSIGLGDEDARYTGQPGSFAGDSIAGSGDVNADGFGDILIGERWANGATTGAAYLVLGSASPASFGVSAADAEFTGSGELDWAGHSVAQAGDFDADGFDDLLIGAPEASDGSGAAFLVAGSAVPASGELTAVGHAYLGDTSIWSAWMDQAGEAVAGAGDVNGDGNADLLIGAPYAESVGCAYLVLGE